MSEELSYASFTISISAMLQFVNKLNRKYRSLFVQIKRAK